MSEASGVETADDCDSYCRFGFHNNVVAEDVNLLPKIGFMLKDRKDYFESLLYDIICNE